MAKRACSIFLAAILGCIPTAQPRPENFPPSYSNVPVGWTMLERTRGTRASQAMVVTDHPIASQVGIQILRAGGNAIDAAVAAAFVLAVIHPTAGNIGGGGFMVYRSNSGAVTALDFREKAPAGATADMFQDSTGQIVETSLIGHLASGVPGSVAGLTAAHARFGNFHLSVVMEPAIRYAEQGVVLDSHRASSFTPTKIERFNRFESSRRKFLADGGPPQEGTLFVQPDLARTLQAISDSGSAGFYRGRVADLLVAEMERGGGIITLEDLKNYSVAWRDPIEITYRNYTVYSMPPPSSGGVTLGETLNILESFDSLPSFSTPEQIHVTAEAMRRAFIDRNNDLGDPDFVDLPLARLLSKDYARRLWATIEPGHASVTPPFGTQLREGDNTTHISVVDADGNAVGITTTLNSSYGNSVVVSGAGFLLNNEMDDFTGAPGQPNQFGLIQGEANSIAPHKRMLSAMAPTIVLDPEGDLFMVLGAPGGPRIITAVTQVLSNTIDFGMSLIEAIGAPRIHHQSLPDQIYYEPGALTNVTIDELEKMGHTVVERTSGIGIISAIMAEGDGWIGVADPRGAGRPAGY